MSSCRAFRPVGVEALEGRELLSHASVTQALASGAAIKAEVAKPAPLGSVGTLGDSYTDEYRFYSPDRSQARNWVEILASTRKVDFGSYTTRSRGEPRNAGFANNWARSDAKTIDMLRDQLPGLTAQVAKGQVKNVVILVGGNDFLKPLEAIAAGQLSPTAYAAELPQITAEAGANLGAAFDRLLAASKDVRIVVATVNVANLAIVQGSLAANPALQPLLQAVNQSVELYNNAIRQVSAANPRIALVDLAANSQQLAQAGTSAPYGGITIQLTQVGDDYHDFFLADGIHPGTVAQGIIADDFVNALDQHFGTAVPPLSPTEIVAYATKTQAQIKAGKAVR